MSQDKSCGACGYLFAPLETICPRCSPAMGAALPASGKMHQSGYEYTTDGSSLMVWLRNRGTVVLVLLGIAMGCLAYFYIAIVGIAAESENWHSWAPFYFGFIVNLLVVSVGCITGPVRVPHHHPLVRIPVAILLILLGSLLGVPGLALGPLTLASPSSDWELGTACWLILMLLSARCILLAIRLIRDLPWARTSGAVVVGLLGGVLGWLGLYCLTISFEVQAERDALSYYGIILTLLILAAVCIIRSIWLLRRFRTLQDGRKLA